MAVDDEHIFFTIGSTPEIIAAAPKAGGSISTLAEVDGGGVAIDASYVYVGGWVRESEGIYRIPKTGGTAQLVVATTPFLGVFCTALNATDFALDDRFVYFGDGAVELARAPKSGGMATTLVSSSNPWRPQTVTQAAVAGGALWFGYSSRPDSLDMAGSCTPSPSHPVQGGFARYDLTTGQVTTIFDGTIESAAYVVAASGDTVYFGHGGSTMALSVGSTTPTQVTDFARIMVADGNTLYWMTDWTTDHLAEIGKTDLSRGSEHVFARGEFHPFGLAVDDAFVYWIEDNKILRAPK